MKPNYRFGFPLAETKDPHFVVVRRTSRRYPTRRFWDNPELDDDFELRPDTGAHRVLHQADRCIGKFQFEFIHYSQARDPKLAPWHDDSDTAACALAATQSNYVEDAPIILVSIALGFSYGEGFSDPIVNSVSSYSREEENAESLSEKWLAARKHSDVIGLVLHHTDADILASYANIDPVPVSSLQSLDSLPQKSTTLLSLDIPIRIFASLTGCKASLFSPHNQPHPSQENSREFTRRNMLKAIGVLGLTASVGLGSSLYSTRRLSTQAIALQDSYELIQAGLSSPSISPSHLTQKKKEVAKLILKANSENCTELHHALILLHGYLIARNGDQLLPHAIHEIESLIWLSKKSGNASAAGANYLLGKIYSTMSSIDSKRRCSHLRAASTCWDRLKQDIVVPIPLTLPGIRSESYSDFSESTAIDPAVTTVPVPFRYRSVNRLALAYEYLCHAGASANLAKDGQKLLGLAREDCQRSRRMEISGGAIDQLKLNISLVYTNSRVISEVGLGEELPKPGARLSKLRNDLEQNIQSIHDAFAVLSEHKYYEWLACCYAALTSITRAELAHSKNLDKTLEYIQKCLDRNGGRSSIFMADPVYQTALRTTEDHMRFELLFV